jgi:vacuolar-type H+-ATPase subunit C/Vma6
LIFSLKNAGVSSRLTEEAMVPLSYNLSATVTHALIHGRLEDAPSILPAIYSKLASESLSLLRTNVPIPLERVFFRRLYADAYSTLRSRALQAGYIVAYLLLCECEAKNLVSITAGKYLSLSEEEILKGLFGV